MHAIIVAYRCVDLLVTNPKWNMPATAFFAKSLFNSSAFNCNAFSDLNSILLSSFDFQGTSLSDDVCEEPSWFFAVILGPVIAIPFAVMAVAIIIPAIRHRRSRRCAKPTPGDECQEKEQQKPIPKQVDYGSSTGLSESATKVMEDDKEDDISSHPHSIVSFYHHSQEHSVMQFFKIGLFRAASSAESQGASPPGDTLAGGDHAEPSVSGVDGFYDYPANSAPNYEDPNYVVGNDPGMFHPPTPAFHTSSSRPRSLSEGTIIAPTKFSTMSPILTPPLPSSLPSSPPISAGTDYQGSHSTFSLSLSDRLEKLNKQIQKKASSSSLASKTRGEKQGSFAVSLNEAGCGAFEMGGSSNKRKATGHIASDGSMDFKCRGLPASGTFSELTDAEASMRAEDELATRQRLEGKIF